MLFNTLLLVVAKAALDALFLLYVQPLFGYEPYLTGYGGVSPVKVGLSYVIAVCLWVIMSSVVDERCRASRFVLLTQYLIVVLPCLVLYGLQDRPHRDVVLVSGSLLLVVILVGRNRLLHVRPPSKAIAKILAGLGLLAIAYVYAGLVASGGLRRLNFDLYAVYEFRKMHSEAVDPGFGYLLPWVAYVIIIAFLTHFAAVRQWRLVLALVAMQLLLFGMTNFKAFLFAPLISVGVILILRRLSLYRAALLGLISMVAAGVVISAAGELMGVSIVRRALFVPAGLHGLYFDHFSQNRPAELSGTRFSTLFQSSYDYDAVGEIGRRYWTDAASPNVGWVGDAYAQFGALGVLAYSIFLALLLRFADSVASKAASRGVVVEALLVGPTMALSNSALPTVLATHGLGVVLIALWAMSGHTLMPRRTSGSEDGLGGRPYVGAPPE